MKLRTAVFAVDDHYDWGYTNDGQSRYCNHLLQYPHYFLTPEHNVITDRVEFALAAWAIATPPIMTPGYIRFPPEVQAVHLTSHGTEVIAGLDIAVPSTDIRASVNCTFSSSCFPEPVYLSAGTPILDCAKAAVDALCRRLTIETGIELTTLLD